MSLNPCFTADQIQEMVSGPPPLTGLQISNLDIPIKYRIWAFLQGNLMFTSPELRLMSADFVDSVLPMYDKIPKEILESAIVEARLYAGGNSSKQALRDFAAPLSQLYTDLLPDCCCSCVAISTAYLVAYGEAYSAHAAAYQVALAAVRAAIFYGGETRGIEEQEKQLEIIREYLEAQ
jgi:hypothetical protein